VKGGGGNQVEIEIDVKKGGKAERQALGTGNSI
jgi:hypothetical protein